MKAPESIRIRMLKSAATPLGALQAGRSYNVPERYARPWLDAGLAEQDKSLDGAPETK